MTSGASYTIGWIGGSGRHWRRLYDDEDDKFGARHRQQRADERGGAGSGDVGPGLENWTAKWKVTGSMSRWDGSDGRAKRWGMRGGIPPPRHHEGALVDVIRPSGAPRKRSRVEPLMVLRGD